MALPKETVHLGAPAVCPECHHHTSDEVCHSAAGYYIGRTCLCGPYSRESFDYYPTSNEAKEALDDDSWTRR